MAAKIYKINFKSDFVLTIQSDAGWAIPFCIKFWTGAPSKAYFVGYDGTNYHNCRMGETSDKLVVLFDDHHLPIGDLQMQIAYHTTIEDFPSVQFDEVTNPVIVKTEIDGQEYHVMLDFTGETAPEIEFSLPAYYNEQQRIANEQERERIFAEMQQAFATMQRESGAATAGAENVNATLNGNILTVTDRTGHQTSSNVQGPPGPPGSGVQADWSETDPSADDYIKNKPTIPAEQVQSDWNQTNNTSKDFIKNKPTIPVVPTNVSDFTNDAGYITKSVNDLVNYYLKSETYTKQEVQALIAAIQQFHYEIYASTSAVTSPAGNVLYLIGPTGTGADKYEEYVYDSTKQEPWVKIGDTSIDLSGYYTSQQTDAAITSALNTALADYTSTAALTLLLAGKQDVINDLATIRSGAAAGATAYQKPQGGIPVSDLALGMDNVPTSGSDNFVKSGGVYSALQGKQDKQLVIEIDYTDTTLPSGTYNSIITALAAGKGVIIELTDEDSVIHNLPLTYNGVNDDGLLLFSCVAGGIDFGVEVSTNNNILVYESNQVTSVNGQTGDVVLSIPDVSTKQDVIDSSHKLSADLVDDTNTTNKFTNATEKQTWNGKQDALVSGTNIKTINNQSILGEGNITIQGGGSSVQSDWNQSDNTAVDYIKNKPTIPVIPSNLAYTSNDNGEGIIPSDGIRAVTVTSAATMTINPDVVTVIDGAVGTAAITLQVPQDNLAHVWDILMTTDSTVAITFAMSNSATILTPSGFSVGASKAVEISVIGVGTKYYLRYGEFA